MKYFVFAAFLGAVISITACKNTNSNAEKKVSTAINVENEQKSAKKDKKKKIIFFGDSLTAAYGLEPEQGYTHLLQERMDSLGMAYQVVNAGLSGETSAGGLGRINWILKQAVDIFVLELGGNDALRGISTTDTYQNLTAIANRVKEKNPNVQLIVAGMEAPPNMGKAFTDDFRAVFPKVAQEQNAKLIPFFLENVGGIPELNLPDGIHPNVEGQKIVAENVWRILKDIL